jgi:hypothetical protein
MLHSLTAWETNVLDLGRRNAQLGAKGGSPTPAATPTVRVKQYVQSRLAQK